MALALPAGATFSDAFAALAEQLPALVGRVWLSSLTWPQSTGK